MELKTKPNGIFFLDYEGPDDAGVIGRRRISLNTRDRKDARQQMQQWMAGTHPKQLEVRQPKRNALVSPKVSETGWTVRKALDKAYATEWKLAKAQTSILSNMKIVNALCGDELVSDMNYNRVQQLIETMRQQGYAEGTIKRKLDTLSKAVSMSSVWPDPKTGKPYIVGKPKWPTLKLDNKRERELWPKEEAAMFAALDVRLKAEPKRRWYELKCLLTILLETGMRLGEGLCLDDSRYREIPVFNQDTGEMVDVWFFCLRAEDTKTGKPRNVPVPASLMKVAEFLSQRSGGGSWFPWNKGSSMPWMMFTELKDDLKGQKVNLDGVVIHTLRHTCANRMRRRRVPVEVVQKQLGHANISITVDRYMHVDNSDVAQAAGLFSNSTSSANQRAASGDANICNIPVSVNERASLGTAH